MCPRAASSRLEGIVVGVPAARRSRETARLVERWGGRAVVGPTVQETPIENDELIRAATEEVIAAPARWGVFLTGVGTRRWLDAAAELGLQDRLLQTLRDAMLIPRGAKALGALAAYGLEAEWSPKHETSEEIVQWLGSRIHHGDTVAVQRHGEPVPAFAAPLQSAGARIIEVATYRWELPADLRPAKRLIDELIDGRVHALVITSAPQVHHLVAIAEHSAKNEELLDALSRRVFVASVGKVASRGLEDHGLAPDLVADPPRVGALIRSLASKRGDVLAKAGVSPQA